MLGASRLVCSAFSSQGVNSQDRDSLHGFKFCSHVEHGTSRYNCRDSSLFERHIVWHIFPIDVAGAESFPAVWDTCCEKRRLYRASVAVQVQDVLDMDLECAEAKFEIATC